MKTEAEIRDELTSDMVDKDKPLMRSGAEIKAMQTRIVETYASQRDQFDPDTKLICVVLMAMAICTMEWLTGRTPDAQYLDLFKPQSPRR